MDVKLYSPEIKDTWPKEGQFYFGYQLSRAHLGAKAIGLYCFEYVDGYWFNVLVNSMHHDHELVETWEDDGFFWSPDYLRLLSQLERGRYRYGVYLLDVNNRSTWPKKPSVICSGAEDTWVGTQFTGVSEDSLEETILGKWVGDIKDVMIYSYHVPSMYDFKNKFNPTQAVKYLKSLS